MSKLTLQEGIVLEKSYQNLVKVIVRYRAGMVYSSGREDYIGFAIGTAPPVEPGQKFKIVLEWEDEQSI